MKRSATGLSRSKVSYLRALCDARDELEGVDWGAMSDDAIMKHLAQSGESDHGPLRWR